jgi:hypothetical protein
MERLKHIETEKERLLAQVRQTETLNGRERVYQNARIEIRDFNPDEVYPTAKYVLKGNLENLEALQTMLDNEGVDIFNLDCVHEGLDGIIIAPPVVELSDGVPAIVDGQHRFYMAKQQGRRIKAIYVEGADENIPVISYPVPWSEVKEYDIKPENPSLLRNLRQGIRDISGDLRRYYRDLSYLGSLGRRPRLGQVA